MTRQGVVRVAGAIRHAVLFDPGLVMRTPVRDTWGLLMLTHDRALICLPGAIACIMASHSPLLLGPDGERACDALSLAQALACDMKLIPGTGGALLTKIIMDGRTYRSCVTADTGEWPWTRRPGCQITSDVTMDIEPIAQPATPTIGVLLPPPLGGILTREAFLDAIGQDPASNLIAEPERTRINESWVRRHAVVEADRRSRVGQDIPPWLTALTTFTRTAAGLASPARRL